MYFPPPSALQQSSCIYNPAFRHRMSPYPLNQPITNNLTCSCPPPVRNNYLPPGSILCHYDDGTLRNLFHHWSNQSPTRPTLTTVRPHQHAPVHLIQACTYPQVHSCTCSQPHIHSCQQTLYGIQQESDNTYYIPKLSLPSPTSIKHNFNTNNSQLDSSSEAIEKEELADTGTPPTPADLYIVEDESQPNSNYLSTAADNMHKLPFADFSEDSTLSAVSSREDGDVESQETLTFKCKLVDEETRCNGDVDVPHIFTVDPSFSMEDMCSILSAHRASSDDDTDIRIQSFSGGGENGSVPPPLIHCPYPRVTSPFVVSSPLPTIYSASTSEESVPNSSCGSFCISIPLEKVNVSISEVKEKDEQQHSFINESSENKAPSESFQEVDEFHLVYEGDTDEEEDGNGVECMSLTVSLPRDKINIKCSNDGSADNFDDVKLNLALEEFLSNSPLLSSEDIIIIKKFFIDGVVCSKKPRLKYAILNCNMFYTIIELDITNKKWCTYQRHSNNCDSESFDNTKSIFS